MAGRSSTKPAMVASAPMDARAQTAVERAHGAAITEAVGAKMLEVVDLT